MILSTDIRKQKLTEVKSSGGSQGKQKLHYMGETRYFDIFRIDLDYLIYNRHNGRIEAEMLTWEQENSAPAGAYDDEHHEKIARLLWDSNQGRNKHTLEDLGSKGQQRPGIVSLDGVVIDGNRRAMLLRKLEGTKGKSRSALNRQSSLAMRRREHYQCRSYRADLLPALDIRQALKSRCSDSVCSLIVQNCPS
jgi:hypothetical protein